MFKVISTLLASYRAVDRACRTRLKRVTALSGILGMGLGATIARPPQPILVWNVTASVPIGLYVVERAEEPSAGEMVLAQLPVNWRILAGARLYIPSGVPLVKYVVAVTGDKVCAKGPEILLNGREIARRLTMDSHGRMLEGWEGCRVLENGDVFLLAPDPASFDSRYFGTIGRANVLGRVRPLWLP